MKESNAWMSEENMKEEKVNRVVLPEGAVGEVERTGWSGVFEKTIHGSWIRSEIVNGELCDVLMNEVIEEI
jgi:hypothetical protein